MCLPDQNLVATEVCPLFAPSRSSLFHYQPSDEFKVGGFAHFFARICQESAAARQQTGNHSLAKRLGDRSNGLLQEIVVSRHVRTIRSFFIEEVADLFVRDGFSNAQQSVNLQNLL